MGKKRWQTTAVAEIQKILLKNTFRQTEYVEKFAKITYGGRGGKTKTLYERASRLISNDPECIEKKKNYIIYHTETK